MTVLSAVEARVPNRLNGLLVLAVLSAALILLWAGARLSMIWVVPLGVVYSFALLTNYALMHEGAHRNLNSDRRRNRVLGMVCSWLFPASFTMMAVTHRTHHACNRTDHEMFDCYYPHDRRWLKVAQWYSILTGLFWLVIPTGAVIMSLAPGLLRTRPFARSRSSGVLFDDFGSRELWRVRLETVGGIGFWLLLYHVLALRWQALAVFYACFAFNWSTRQYVTHAFSPRDVLKGAWNLKVSRVMRWILLNGHWDQVHHQQPHLPWTALPQAGKHSATPSLSYWRQYLRLWKGPVPAAQPGPPVRRDICAWE